MRFLTRFHVSLLSAILAGLFMAEGAHAHGQAGGRTFIEPFVTEDANVQNEAVVQGSYVRRAGRDPWLLTYEIEKTLSENTSLFIGHGAAFDAMPEEEGGEAEVPEEEEMDGDAQDAGRSPASTGHGSGNGGEELASEAGGGEEGFLNTEIGVKRRIWKNDKHEAVVSLAAAVEVPTGARRVGAEDHAALEFAALFVKGFGDLPGGLSFLRPLAAQGDVRWETPLGEGRPVNAIAYNLALSYDLRTLHAIVDFPSILEPLAFVTEFNFETVVNGAERGQTERYITPGLVYSTRKVQVGVALQVPLHDDETDFIVLPTVAFFYDAIFPGLGRNLFP